MPRDEAQTRIELIDPALWARGWSEELIRREKTPGGVDIVEGVPRRRRGRSDYLLCLPILPGKPPLAIALIEAKAESKLPALGLQQGRDYQRRFNVPFVFSTNGYLYAAYGDDTRTIKDNLPLGDFPTPEELRARYEAHRGFSLESDAARPLVMPYKGGEAARYYGAWQLLRHVAVHWVCQRDSIDCVKSDARRVSGTTREALRERGVKMVLAGRTHAVVAQSLGVHLRTVSLWMARHQLRGFEGLREGRRGRRSREQMALTDAQQAELIRLMKGTNPDQLQIPGVLWSRQAVKALIERRFGLGLSRQTVGVYLRRWGFSGKKPQRRWLEQDPERVRVWLQDEFLAIQARARREGARMLFGDEMGVRAGQTAGKSYAPIGERAIVPLTGKRFSANVISAIGADARWCSRSSRAAAMRSASWTSSTSCSSISPSARSS